MAAWHDGRAWRQGGRTSQSREGRQGMAAGQGRAMR
jgi:hypothetical protein